MGGSASLSIINNSPAVLHVLQKGRLPEHAMHRVPRIRQLCVFRFAVTCLCTTPFHVCFLSFSVGYFLLSEVKNACFVYYFYYNCACITYKRYKCVVHRIAASITIIIRKLTLCNFVITVTALDSSYCSALCC